MRALHREVWGGVRDGGVETGGGDSSEMGSVKNGKKKSTASIGASLTPDFRDNEESNNKHFHLT